MRQSARSLLLRVLILFAAACGSSPDAPDERPIPPDDRGTLVALGEPLALSGFVWSADSREVFVFTRRQAGSVTSYILRAYDPISQVHRVVAESPTFPESFQASESGQWLYYSSVVPAGRDIFRVAKQGGSPERVTAGGSQPGFAVSGDARYVAYVPTPHTVTVFDAVDQARREFAVSDALAVLVMAPDASEIAVISGFTTGNAVDVLATETGAVRRVHTRQDPSPGSPGGGSLAVGGSWKSDALHLLFMDVDPSRTPAFRERNTTTGAETSLGTMTSVDALDVQHVSWTPATSAAAALVAKDCLRSSGLSGLCLRRYEMFVVSGGQARLVGTANLPEVGATSALSPDGRWLAVGSDESGLSVKQLPP